MTENIGEDGLPCHGKQEGNPKNKGPKHLTLEMPSQILSAPNQLLHSPGNTRSLTSRPATLYIYCTELSTCKLLTPSISNGGMRQTL